MKQYLFLILFFFSVCLSAQDKPQYAAQNIPDSLLENASYVYRKIDRKITVKSSSEGMEEVTEVITILNEESNGEYISIRYDKSTKVKSLKVRLYDAVGNYIRKIDKDEIHDYSSISDFSIYEDDRIKALKTQHSSYPYTIELTYKRALKGMIFVTSFKQVFYLSSYSVEQFNYTIDLPSTLGFVYKMNKLSERPTINETANRTTYHWNIKGLKPLFKESFGPPSWEFLPGILIALKSFKVDDYQGSMASWAEYGQFLNQLWDGKDDLPEEVKAKVRELTQNEPSNRAKIAKLYAFMQSQMRYVSVQLGIGGWQPFDANYVWKNKYGDCKALTNFMKGMLREIGIKSYPTLVFAGDQYYSIEDNFVYPAFNHVILHIPDEDIWLECTSNTKPINYLDSDVKDRRVLLITEQGGQIVETPSMRPEDNTKSSKVVILLSEKGAAQVKGTLHSSGTYHDRLRNWNSHHSQEDIEKNFLKRTDFPSPRIEKLSISASLKTPTAQLNYELNVPRYATKAGRRLFMPVNLVNPFTYVMYQDTARTTPIHYTSAKVWQDTITFEIPENYIVEGVPHKELVIERDYASYDLKIEQVDRRLRYTRKLRMEAVVLPPEAFEDFRNFFKEVVKAEKMKIVLAKKRT